MHKQGPLDLWSLARARMGSNIAKVGIKSETCKKSEKDFRKTKKALSIDLKTNNAKDEEKESHTCL